MSGHSSTVVVTGAAGFIGSHLSSALLARGCRVVGIDNFDEFYDRASKQRNVARITSRLNGGGGGGSGGFELIEGDIRDRAMMIERCRWAGPSAVVHIAALAGVRPSIAAPGRYVSVNCDGLVSALEAARAAGCGRFIFASSSSVYGNNSKVPFSEDDPVSEPISPYAATKRAGELICQAYAQSFGMRIAALRFFTVYGPAQRPDLAISKFMRLIAAGEEVPMFGDGSTSRDYTYIDDIISGVLAAHDGLAAAKTGFFRIYNLGSDHPITLAQMIESIAQVVGKPARIKRLPMQTGDVERTWADVTRAASELNYAPQTRFADGLSRQWAWQRSATPIPAQA